MVNHKPQPSRRRKPAFAIAGAGLAIVLAMGVFSQAGAADPTAKRASVHLNLNGGYANHNVTACGDLHHYTYYHRGSTIHFNGSVSPAPTGSYRVKLKLKECKSGTFRTVYQKHFKGHPGGQVKGAFSRNDKGYYYARLYYYGTTPTSESDKQQFKVSH